ncbi:MAG: Starch-binding associating with outer rane [Sphingobacteriales bacterium]|nr:Starch-binding associating with outer rane [Sphingobacteriales bacterium]
MKKLVYVFTVFFILSSCKKLDVLPQSILQDKDVFSSASGVSAYYAALYNLIPLEDSKYNANEGDGFHEFQFIQAIHNMTGEGINKNVNGMIQRGAQREYWEKGYRVIRQCNYILENIEAATAGAGMTQAQVNSWLGEAYFLRAYTYFALVKRYGGVPLIKTVQDFPAQSIDELQVPRSSEQEAYDFIAEDCDKAFNLLGATSEQRGRANKYIAAGLKSRAMLFAGSIAKYNVVNNVDPATSKRVQGIPASEAVRYFKASYEASKVVATGGYALHRPSADKKQNCLDAYIRIDTKESMFAREYVLGNNTHSYDVFGMSLQMQSPNGTTSYIQPTLEYVELFDGIPKNPDGSIKTTDANNKYIYFDKRFDLFKDAEPRFQATILPPGAIFKNQEIDIRRGLYTGSIVGGIDKFQTPPYGSQSNYAAIPGVIAGTNGGPLVTMPSGTKMVASGLSGMFTGSGAGSTGGFQIRKKLIESLAQNEVKIDFITTPWIDMRYAEILLNRAEAAYELFSLGQTDVDYVQDAFLAINDIRERAGAVLLADKIALNDINIIRKERKKELGFENKIFWDMKRWRVFDTEVNNRIWKVLCPFYVDANGKYIFDRREDERGSRFTFNPTWYYESIPPGQIVKNPKLVPNI